MKFDKKDENSYLGIIAIGLFLTNLGYFLNKYTRDTSFDFLNGLKAGICVGAMIVGVGVFAYGLVGIIKLKRK